LNGISNSGWVPLARLLRPQGRRGELLADPLSDLPDIFTAGRELTLAAPNTSTPAPNAPTLRIEEHFFPTGKNAGRVVLKLSGCDSITQAEALAGHQLLLPSDQLPTLDPDTFFVGDLVGCTLFNADQPIGTIVDVEFATAPDGRTRLEDAAPLLAVQLLPSPNQAPEPASPSDPIQAPDPVLIPFVRAWLDTVDIPARRITMHLPEGLLTTPDPTPDDPAQS
jgi:16S rRNA processing protein RimM